MLAFLSEYISVHGENAIFDIERIEEFAEQKNKKTKKLYQCLFILKHGNIRDFIERVNKTVTSVELNSMIINCVHNTGLNMECVQGCLIDILSALGYNCRFESVYMPSNNGTGEINLQTVYYLYDHELKEDLARAERLMKFQNTSEAISIYTRLAKSGSALAMYNLGNCYYEGIGTEKDPEKALELFRAAAMNGNSEACAKLGDYYYYNKDITKRSFAKAYDYYSKAGTLTVSPKVKDNIVNILNQEKANKFNIITSGIALLFMWIFTFVCSITVHNMMNLTALGIVINVVCTAIYGTMIFYYTKIKYNNIKYFIVLMTIIWSIYPIILAIN